MVIKIMLAFEVLKHYRLQIKLIPFSPSNITFYLDFLLKTFDFWHLLFNDFNNIMRKISAMTYDLKRPRRQHIKTW